MIAVTRKSLFTIDEDQPHAFLGSDRRAVINPPGSVIDIDEPLDLLIAESILRMNIKHDNILALPAEVTSLC